MVWDISKVRLSRTASWLLYLRLFTFWNGTIYWPNISSSFFENYTHFCVKLLVSFLNIFFSISWQLLFTTVQIINIFHSVIFRHEVFLNGHWSTWMLYLIKSWIMMLLIVGLPFLIKISIKDGNLSIHLIKIFYWN